MSPLTPVPSKAPDKREAQNAEESDRFNQVLGQVVEALEGTSIRYVFIGGIASGGLGRPRSTRDIDLFVMPEDAALVLQALERNGFQTEKTDPAWLFKAWKENVLVDVIFKSKGDIYLDPEMYQRVITAEFHGRRLKLVAPEDLLIIKAAAHSELTPGHWHDAIAILARANIDWDYLVRRARRAPRRILSLLLYAQSNDIWVPNGVIHEIYTNIFSERRPGQTAVPERMNETKHASVPRVEHVQRGSGGAPGSDYYRAAHLRERLAEDPRTNELDITIAIVEGRVVLRGDVCVPERRDAAERIAHELFPTSAIQNEIRVLKIEEASEREEIK